MATLTQFRTLVWGVVVAVMVMGAVAGAMPLYAQAAEDTARTLPVTSQVLNADGTLNLATAQEGALELSGWDVRLDAQRGPILTRAVNDARGQSELTAGGSHQLAEAERWIGLGNGVNGMVFALALRGQQVYVGGIFDGICADAACSSMSKRANNIARWNGQEWSALGNGVNGTVYVIAVDGSGVYVGGDFTQLCGNAACSTGGQTVNRIAKWTPDTGKWSALKNGVSRDVYALAFSGKTLYAAGWFEQVCGNAACTNNNTRVNYIARWDGSDWQRLGNGLDSTIDGIAISGNDLYAGGIFDKACGNAACNSGNTTVNRIAHWNGTSWTAMGYGVSASVYVIAIDGSTVYAGGLFLHTCGNVKCDNGNLRVNNIAQWDGSRWAAMDKGLNGVLYGFALDGHTLYAGGTFKEICGSLACQSGNVSANHVAEWSKGKWTTLAYGVSDNVNWFVSSPGTLYVGGVYTEVCGNAACTGKGTSANRVAVYGSCLSKPSKVTLRTPTDHAVVTTRQPNLRWNAATCANTYRVYVTDAATGAIVDQKMGLEELGYQTIQLAMGKTYRWYIKGCNSFGVSVSDTWSFTVQ